MSTNSKLQSAIHLALGLSAGVLAVSVVPNVFAQGIDAQDADADEAIEEVIVTGSRIRRADIDSASPVTILERDDMIARVRADQPVHDDWFLSLNLISDSVVEFRRIPTPVGPQTSNDAGDLDVFGSGDQRDKTQVTTP